MKQDYRENVKTLIRFLGGSGNIVSVTNCMTRLRVTVKDASAADEEKLRAQEEVMGLVHDRENDIEIVVGPGKSRKYADLCHEMGLPSGSSEASGSSGTAGFGKNGADDRENPDWRTYKEKVRGQQKESRVRSALKMIGDIFVPLIPGIITAGLCAGLASLIAQIVPDYSDRKALNIVWQLLTLINRSFMTYMTAWAGYRAAERFGATPILGGMLGMITTLDGINQISLLMGLYNEQSPLDSVLTAGKGGVLAVIIGVFLLAKVEKKIRSRMPESVDVIFTPLLTLLVCVIPYILVIMPLLGYVSGGIVWVFSRLCMSESVLVRIIAGYVSTALFLPLVAAGMHHGLVALYSVQLQELGYVTLYPALAMAGAGQVGTAIALWFNAKRAGNRRLCSVISGALPAGFLGIGEPLIYGVTLPLGKPFITAGLGAGFGGALVMAFEVAATTWGPSGLLGIFVMTAGPRGAVASALIYLAGLIVSYICSFIITGLTINWRGLMPEEAENGMTGQPGDAPEQELPQQPEKISPGQQPEKTLCRQQPEKTLPGQKPASLEEYRSVRRGELLFPEKSAGKSDGASPSPEQEPAAGPGGRCAELFADIAAPADGKQIPGEEIPDPVFADRSIWQCVGILPENGIICAPCDGVVSGVTATKHALTFTASNGREILVHAGIDTVSLDGRGFTVFVQEGQAVSKGDKVMETDLDLIRAAGLSPMVITAIESDGEQE